MFFVYYNFRQPFPGGAIRSAPRQWLLLVAFIFLVVFRCLDFRLKRLSGG
jgi:hypothetical protein